jgi:hypothetical protein
MSRNSRKRILIALALMALIAGVGCSSLPTGPEPDAALDGASKGGAETAGTAWANPTPIAAQPATSSKTVYGVAGGQVSAGNFTVVIPPLAISGTATVTVTQPDASKPYVSLRIFPASANKFRVPVTLIANAAPMSTEKLALAYISWFNPSTRRWEPMASKVNLESRTVMCPLRHFSNYAVESGGKAGW